MLPGNHLKFKKIYRHFIATHGRLGGVPGHMVIIRNVQRVLRDAMFMRSCVFTGLAESDVGPVFHDEAEAPFARRQVGQVAVRVPGEVRLAFFLEFRQDRKSVV